MGPGAKDVARLAGLSRSQVSNYFNNPELVSADAKRRISDAIDELGYIRDEAARQLRLGSSHTIGLLLIDAWAPFFSEICVAIENEAEKGGWRVQVMNSHANEERERDHLNFFHARRIDGVIVVPQGDVSRQLERLAAGGMACVLLDPPHWYPVPDSIPSIAVDHLEGGRLAAAHLLGQGGTSFAYAGDPSIAKHVEDRYTGFQRYLHENGRAARLIRAEGLSVATGTAAAAAILTLPDAERPNAVFAGNDLVALGMLNALGAAGLSVPGDIRVMGYDDIVMAAQVTPALTTIRQDAQFLGTSATRMLIQQIADQPMASVPHHVLRPELVEREST